MWLKNIVNAKTKIFPQNEYNTCLKIFFITGNYVKNLLNIVILYFEMATRKIPYLLFSKYSSYLSRNVFIKTPQKKTFHCTVNMNVKMFMENENKYAYEVMLKNGYVDDLNVGENKIQSTKTEEFQNFQNKNWSKQSHQNLYETFSSLCTYCSEQNISIADQQFDDYIDSLTDKIKFATDEELKLLFYCLSKFPQTESIKTRNFIEVWVALDDECFRRINSWTFDEMLSFLSLFYMLNITRASDFTYKCLLKLANKAKKLTKSQVIQTLFFIGTARKAPPDIHNLEVFIEENFLQYSVDELAVIAMGLFKSKTPIRSSTLVSNIIDKIIRESYQIHEISLASLLKIIRYSLKVCTDNKIYELLDTLQYEIPRLSVMCNVHIALVGTSTLTLHENCLTKIAERIQASITFARIKDIERLILTYGTFNYIPKTNTCFFSQILEELRNPSRVEEVKKHGRSFACSIAYLGLLGIYPKDLINKVLSKEFLEDTYGKHCYQFGREILSIHNMAKIFLKDDNMNLLNEKHVTMLSKKFTDYIPSESFKKQYNVSERMFLDVNNVLEIMRGGRDFVTGHHIVTHHQRGDLILCNDHEGKPQPVTNAFSKTKFGLLCTPPDDNIWIVLIIAGRNTMIRNSNSATGHFESKVKELEALGFKSAVVKWNAYNNLKSIDEKIEFLSNLIQRSINEL